MFTMKHTLSFLLLSCLRTIEAAPINEITADSIQWAPCQIDFGTLEDQVKIPLDCAKLNVPLDYTKPDCPEKLSLQLIKINATKAPFRGSVIFNPGGPGDTGVLDLATRGPLYNR